MTRRVVLLVVPVLLGGLAVAAGHLVDDGDVGRRRGSEPTGVPDPIPILRSYYAAVDAHLASCLVASGYAEWEGVRTEIAWEVPRLPDWWIGPRDDAEAASRAMAGPDFADPDALPPGVLVVVAGGDADPAYQGAYDDCTRVKSDAADTVEELEALVAELEARGADEARAQLRGNVEEVVSCMFSSMGMAVSPSEFVSILESGDRRALYPGWPTALASIGIQGSSYPSLWRALNEAVEDALADRAPSDPLTRVPLALDPFVPSAEEVEVARRWVGCARNGAGSAEVSRLLDEVWRTLLSANSGELVPLVGVVQQARSSLVEVGG